MVSQCWRRLVLDAYFIGKSKDALWDVFCVCHCRSCRCGISAGAYRVGVMREEAGRYLPP